MVVISLILILWIACVLFTLSIIFEVSFSTIANWFFRAYTKSPAARRFQETTRYITNFTGTEPTRMTLAIMSNIIPFEQKPHARRKAPQRLDDIETLYKILAAPNTHQLVVNSIQSHVSSQCSLCCPSDEQWVVVSVNPQHYSEIYDVFSKKNNVSEIDLMYLRPHTSFRTTTTKGATFHTALKLSPEPTNAHIQISGRSLRLGSTCLISEPELVYTNGTRHHVAILRISVS